MALINTSVPNLIQGVSQQPDATRFDGQCEEQENALSSVADGLKKRPNTRHIARLLDTAIASNSFVHFINRDNSEKYVVIHDGTKLYAYNIITGAEASINGSTGGYTPPTGSYLDVNDPINSMKGLTVADRTYLLNATKAVALNTVTSPSLDKEALLFIKQGDYEKLYGVNVTIHRTDLGTFTAVQVTPQLDSSYSSSVGAHYTITGLSVDGTGGSGYTTAPSVFVTSNTSVVSQPNITANMSDDGTGNGTLKVDSFTVNNGGAIMGVGGGWLFPGSAPTLNFTIAVNANFESGTELTANIRSSNNDNSFSAGSARIAEQLAKGTPNTYDASVADNMSNTGVTGIGLYFNVQRYGNLITMTKKDTWDGDFTVTTYDDLAGNGLGSVYKEVDSISSLPLYAKNGFKVKVTGDLDLNQDDYYVEFSTANGASIGEGGWVECIGYDVPLGFDDDTMPHNLINNNVDSFIFEPLSFADRNCGDLDSNPNPSFVGAVISNMFFFKNRLGFLNEDNVSLSESGLAILNELGILEYNFFRNTVSSLLDSDPIDVSVASTRVTSLKAAVGFQENLIMFSDGGQFVLKGGELLTPKTVSISPVTSFGFAASIQPLSLGSYLYFPFTRGSFTGLREFSVNATTDIYDSSEVTEHVPAYIPKNIIDMAGTTSEEIIALLSSNEKGSLYIYNYFWNNNQKVLSAWSKFTVTGEIRGIEFIDSTLYAVTTYNGETNLVELPLESGLTDVAGYVTNLDMRVAATVSNGDNVINLPYTPEDNSVEVYTTDGLALNCSNVGSTVTLSNPVASDTDIWAGIPYTMKYTFSEQLFKAQAGNGKSPSNAAKMLIRNCSLYYDKSAFFKVKVTPKFRDTYENVFTPDVVGSTTLGSLNLDSGFYRFPVFTKPEDTTITIENDSALPSTFQSAEFESFVHSRSNRYG
jgi:hypothetical protein